MSSVERAIERTGCTPAVAIGLVRRNVEVAAELVAQLEAMPRCYCVEEVVDGFRQGCVHWRQLVEARTYHGLARAGAPQGAYPCKCDYDGIYWRKDGLGRPVASTCFGCNGKGWQSHDDRRRNDFYWAHVARIPA